MDDIFSHDATPTWDGFIYQGSIALYLVIKEINKLLELAKVNNEDFNVENCYFDVETAEDICIFEKDKKTKEKKYISIHQCKNEKKTDYKQPLIQLMLEKGYYKTKNSGDPLAYLHLRNHYNFDIEKYTKKYKDQIINFYLYFKDINLNKIDIDYSEIIEKITKEPIKLSREKYKNCLNLVKKFAEDKNENEFRKQINEFLSFLENEICVQNIDENVDIYLYENNNRFINSSEINDQILIQIKRYYTLAEKSEIHDQQYTYIKYKLSNYMEKYVKQRHEYIINKDKKVNSNNKTLPVLEASFEEILNILDYSVYKYEKEINVLELKYLLQERIGSYCYICRKDKKCNLLPYNCYLNEYFGNDMSDESFLQLCYSLNPDCEHNADDRKCIGYLLNEDGLSESVFKVLKALDKSLLVDKEKKNCFVVKYDYENYFITAISSNNGERVTSKITRALERNENLISHIFEADTLVTSRLTAEKDVWGTNFVDMSNIYEPEKNNNICEHKKPNFIQADAFIIEKLL